MKLRAIALLFILAMLLTVAETTASPGAGVVATAVATTQADPVDLTHLPVGDGRLSNGPKVGWIWPCHIQPNAGGAFKDGPWIKRDGTYDFSAKAVVDGAITWPQHHLEVQVQGDRRIISTNDQPNHVTGIFPIAPTDDAYQFDRNPNKIGAQNFRIELPATPTLAERPSCVPGAIGVLLTGTVLFNALDAPGRDAVAHETQDACQGHPERSGTYHYHSLTTCLPDTTSSDGHSVLMGYSLDGFGIYGRHGEGGKILTSADLDECHGHTHRIEWNGKMVVMYHYHATWDFPYTVGCMRGVYKMSDVMTISGSPSGPGRPGGPPPKPGTGQR